MIITKPNHHQAGFTLIELLISMSIFVMVMIIGANFIMTSFKSNRFTSEQEEAIQNARKATENLIRDVREAKISERGDFPLVSIGAQEFIWYGDIDNDGETEKIKYLLDGINLIRIVTQPGALNNYDGGSATTTIATYLNNQAEPIFHYYDDENNATPYIGDVRMVLVKLKVNVTPAIAPADYYVETSISLRNLKDNL